MVNNMSNTNEYSGTDTLDRRTANAYLNQYNYQINNMSMNTKVLNNSVNNNSVGYSNSKEIRTNLNNIDYAANSTMYRRPQLHPSIYDRSVSIPEGSDSNHRMINGTNGQQFARTTNNNNNISILNNHGLPPPPPPMHFDPMSDQTIKHFETEDNYNTEFDDEDDLIPNWVPIERCLEKVKTTYDYEGLREDELSFKENMFIYVIKKNDDHWYEGIMKSENGDIVQGNTIKKFFNLCLVKILLKFNLK